MISFIFSKKNCACFNSESDRNIREFNILLLLSRTERPRKTKIGTPVAHDTRDSDTTFKVNGQGHQAALLTAALTRRAAAAVSVGTY